MVMEDTSQRTEAIELTQQDTEMLTSGPTSRSSYVTYTDLTPFSPDSHFNVPLPSTFSPSILSELHDDFGFPSDPDLDPSSLLNTSEITFPQPLQDQMEVVSCHNGSVDLQWSREARQKEIDEARRQKLANQRRDKLWTNLTDQKYKELWVTFVYSRFVVSHHSFILVSKTMVLTKWGRVSELIRKRLLLERLPLNQLRA
jgi:hypothetical protein